MTIELIELVQYVLRSFKVNVAQAVIQSIIDSEKTVCLLHAANYPVLLLSIDRRGDA